MGNLALTGKYDLRTNCEAYLGVFSFGLSACDQLHALKGTNVLSASLKNMRLRLDFKLNLENPIGTRKRVILTELKVALEYEIDEQDYGDKMGESAKMGVNGYLW